MLEGNYIVIKYKNKIVCYGKVTSSKTNCGRRDMKLVSIDDRYYFNLNNKDITYIISEFELENYICLDDIPVILWRECTRFPSRPLYKEYTIDELDKEVAPLVHAMNKIKYIKTVGSCCGHGNRPLWIDFTCDDYNTLNLFLNLFNYEGNFKYDWTVCTNYKLITFNKNDIILELKCKHLGQRAYDCVNELSIFLETFGEQNNG